MRQNKHKFSFTLIELLLVLGILAVLIGIFLPNFSRARDQAQRKEAIANLRLIHAAERIYRLEHSFFYPCNDPGDPNCTGFVNSTAEINRNLKLNLAESGGFWGYKINTPQDYFSDFTAQADRSGQTSIRMRRDDQEPQ